jgi:hypothetical protein
MTMRVRRMPCSAAVLALVLHLSPAPASPRSARDPAGAPARPEGAPVGAVCTVCGGPPACATRTLTHLGRAVPLCARLACEATFRLDPEPHFRAQQPRAALFHEDAVPRRQESWIWFLVGLWVTTAALAAGAAGHAAVVRGIASWRGFLAGLMFHAPGYLWVRSFPELPAGAIPDGLAKVPATSVPSHCAACGWEVHPSADRCAHCRSTLTPPERSEARRVLAAPSRT